MAPPNSQPLRTHPPLVSEASPFLITSPSSPGLGGSRFATSPYGTMQHTHYVGVNLLATKGMPTCLVAGVHGGRLPLLAIPIVLIRGGAPYSFSLTPSSFGGYSVRETKEIWIP